MLESLHWGRALRSPEAKEQLDELRSDALRVFALLATAGYLVWYFVSAAVDPTEGAADAAYAVSPIALPTLVGTWVLIPQNRRAATLVLVAGGLLSITWSLYVLQAAQAATLYVLVALAAAFIVHPLGGFLVVGGALGLLVLVAGVSPGLLEASDLLEVALFAGLAVSGVWVLTSHLFVALNWYADSYARAMRQTREAQEHRAQLVQAWQQLDAAYYRLERTNAALQLAWKAANEAERSKLELATNISHEFRTPLNLIVGYSEMVMTSPQSYQGVELPAPYRGDISAIYRAAQHLLALTDDVLDLARMEVGRLGLLREPVDLLQVIRDAATLVRDFVEAKGLELRLDLPDSLPPLVLDRLRIRQVLLNLLTNAARFSQAGHVEVKVFREPDHVRVCVTDTGPGIAPEDLPGVFQRFATRDIRRPDWPTGAGLGLPISKSFVELHGGEMGVESTLGVGTTFWFTLPFLPSSRADVAVAAPSSRPAVQLRDQEQVVVLAHPDGDLGRLLQRHLEGYRVEVARNLDEAKMRAQELKATAIVADLDAQSEPEPGPVPVVRCQLPHRGRSAERLMVADYLVKPISREALLSAVGRLGTPIDWVLVVDDDVRFVRLLTRMLSSGDFTCVVSTAHNGEEALARMRANRPDLVLLDLEMPVLDGIGVLHEMAADPVLRGIKVIVVSAHGEEEGIATLGGEIRISKPEGFQLAELTQVIGAAVSKLAPVRAYLS